MEDEFHEMDDLNVKPDPEEDDQETSFIENDSDDDYEISFVRNDPEDEVTISEERTRRIKRSFDYKNVEDFFTNILDLEPRCSNHKFIDYIIDSEIFSIKRVSSLTGDYVVKYLGGDYQSIGMVVTNDEMDLLRSGIRGYYDEWNKIEMNKILKKAGIATAISLSIIALTTGLIVGLTRKGADIVHQAKKWEKLTPSISRKSIPWTELEKATGRAIIFTGEYIVIIITLVGIFVYSK